jgi:hypothetical protein
MNSNRALVILAACATVLAAGHANAYDAASDFSTASNPNGVWRYGYSIGSGYAYLSFDVASSTSWSSSTYQSLGAPAIWLPAPASLTLNLHPGPDPYSPAILRFTAPASGTYAYAVQFFAGDSGVMNGGVFVNGNTASPLVYFASTNANPGNSGTVLLLAGDTLDVTVGNNGSFFFGTTPVAFSISAVPEPAPAALLLAGLAVLGLCGRYTRRA